MSNLNGQLANSPSSVCKLNDDFIERLSSAAPTPGGGGACAVCASVASALSSMVGNLAVGKAAYADVQEELSESLAKLDMLRKQLLELADEDARAFEPLALAYKMPKATKEELEEKNRCMQSALIGATDVPLRIMQACMDVLIECDTMSRIGAKSALTDAGACAVLANGALVGASLNVFVNINSLDNEKLASDYRRQADALCKQGEALADEIYLRVANKVGGYGSSS